MRKLLATILAVLLLAMGAVASDGPIDKGSVILGGGAYFSSQSGDLYEYRGASVTTILVSPAIAYFVAPGTLVGVQTQFVSTSSGGAGVVDLAIGPVIGYYFKTKASHTEIRGSVYPYIQGFLLYWSLSDGRYKKHSFGGQGGFCYMLSGSVSANVSFLFQYDSQTRSGRSGTYSGTVKQFGIGFTAFLWN